jgi:hypothetical protein
MELKDSIAVSAFIVSLTALLVNYLGAQRRDVLGIRPVLVFEYQESGWRVHNIGSGPAMDIIFTRLSGIEVHDNVRLPALAKDADFRLHFARHDNVHRFAATYRDLEGRPYTSQSAKDVSVAGKGFLVPRPAEANLIQWWRLPESDS